MKRKQTTTLEPRQVVAGGERRPRLWGRLSVPALFGLAVALALLTPLLGLGSYLASLLVAGAAVVAAATAPVRPTAAERATARPPDAVRLGPARSRREHRLHLPRERRRARRERATPRAGV